MAIDHASQVTKYHPHMSAPFLKKLLKQAGKDYGDVQFFITVRHPLHALKSYYAYFNPDLESRYNYQADWDNTKLMPFDQWLMEGHIGINPEWSECCPSWVTNEDFSPISFEALAHNIEGHSDVNKVLKIEEPETIESWLSARLGVPELKLSQLNRSNGQMTPVHMTSDVKKRLRKCFPFESKLYDV